MADELISFSMPIQGREVPFSFKKMTAEHAASVISKMKARSNYYEVVRRELKRAEETPIHLRDEVVYIGLLEKEQSVRLELGKAAVPMLSMIVTPSREELLVIMEDEKNNKDFQAVMERYFKELFPSEEDRKKS